MDRLCETCGQTLPTSPVVHAFLPGGVPGAAGSEVLDVELMTIGDRSATVEAIEKTSGNAGVAPIEEVDDERSGTRPRWLWIVGLAAAVLVGVLFFSGGDDSGPVAGSTGDDGSRNAVDDAEESARPTNTLGPFDRNEPFAEPEVVDAQSGALGELIGSNRLGYLAADGVVIVDLEAGVAPTAKFEPENFDQLRDLAKLSGFELLSEGDTTYGIATGDKLVVHQFSNSGRLTRTDEDSLFSITSDPTDDWERLFVATTAGFFMADLEIPGGSTYLNVDGLGTLVSPPTGGTFLAGIEGFSRYSDHRIVAATSGHHVEIQCDAELICHPYLLDRATADWEQIPDEFAGDQGTVSISPDGRWVLRTGSDDDVAFDSDTGGFHRLDGREKGPIVWAPDSTFAVWFDPLTNDPLLQVLYPERRSSETIDLSELGGADRAGSEVVVFS